MVRVGAMAHAEREGGETRRIQRISAAAWNGSPAKLDRFAVRRVAVRIGPRFLPVDERRGIEQPLCLHEVLERGKPMVVIVRSIVRFTALRGRVKFAGQRRRPFLPREMTLLGELDGERERLRLPGLGEHRATVVAWEARQPRESVCAKSTIRRGQDSRPTCRDE